MPPQADPSGLTGRWVVDQDVGTQQMQRWALWECPYEEACQFVWV